MTKLSTTWKTKDGREIAIRYLSDDHLQNIKRFLEKHVDGLKLREEWEWVKSSGMLNEELAQDVFDSAFEWLLFGKPVEWLERFPPYMAICQEIERRVA